MRAKAIMNLSNPNLAEPIYPIRVMKTKEVDGGDTKEDSTITVMIDDLYKFKMEKCMFMWKT